MKTLSVFALISLIFLTGFYSSPNFVSLFDSKTFNGWQGDTSNTWHIENGTMLGGSIDKMVPQNNFLCTKRSYANFILKLKVTKRFILFLIIIIKGIMHHNACT